MTVEPVEQEVTLPVPRVGASGLDRYDDVIDLTGHGPDGLIGSESEVRLPPGSPRRGRSDRSAECRYGGLGLVSKWVFDRISAIAALLLLAPLVVVVGLAIAVSSPGPVFFKQTRVGRGGRPFTIYKFRTMRPDAEDYLADHPDLAARHRENDFKLSIEDDVRITRIGRLLRKTSLDELPQLWNIVRGDMSVVGPRPVVPEEVVEYGPYREMYESAYPGLTGAWQVTGRDDTKFPERARLDAQYVENWSFSGDIVIILRTVPALFDPRRGL